LLLEGIDYRLAAFDGINRFYVRIEDEDLLPAFATSANVLDNFVPYEYVRLFQEFSHRIEHSKPSVIDALRRDAVRLGRKVRSAVQGLASQAG
jgi:hypothetical protein